MNVVPRAKLPVVIVCFNLVSDLRQLVSWLEATGHERIILLDNASTWPPMLEYLNATPHEVIRLRANLGHQAPWLTGLTRRLGGPFVVTDPDVLPDQGCPPDTVEHLQRVLASNPMRIKVGLGLRIDDLPATYPHRDDLILWESQFWRDQISPGVYSAGVDTTFALHRPRAPYALHPALRTGPPYVARHLPWYRDPRNPDEETQWFYRHRRADVGFWNRTQLPYSMRQALTRMRGRR